MARSYEERLRDEFGTTADASTAGFIFPDGDMLDLHEGYGYRADHRAINVVSDIRLSRRLKRETGGDNMIMHYLMDKLNLIRLIMEAPGFEITKEPTSHQERTLLDIVNTNPTTYYVDMVDVGKHGKILESFSKDYDMPEDWDRFIRDMNKFYYGSVRPVTYRESFKENWERLNRINPPRLIKPKKEWAEKVVSNPRHTADMFTDFRLSKPWEGSAAKARLMAIGTSDGVFLSATPKAAPGHRKIPGMIFNPDKSIMKKFASKYTSGTKKDKFMRESNKGKNINGVKLLFSMPLIEAQSLWKNAQI